MRGHEPLIAMRLRGRKPASVWVWDRDDFGMSKAWHQRAESQAKPLVLIEPAENLQRLDLRFAVGLTVFIDTEQPERMQAMVDAFHAAGAHRVVGISSRPSSHPTSEDLVMVDTRGAYNHG